MRLAITFFLGKEETYYWRFANRWKNSVTILAPSVSRGESLLSGYPGTWWSKYIKTSLFWKHPELRATWFDFKTWGSKAKELLFGNSKQWHQNPSHYTHNTFFAGGTFRGKGTPCPTWPCRPKQELDGAAALGCPPRDSGGSDVSLSILPPGRELVGTAPPTLKTSSGSVNSTRRAGEP